MSRWTAVFLTLIVIAGAAFAGPPVDVKTVDDPLSLPEAFTKAVRKGDLLVSGEGWLALVGGTPRPMRTPMNYPAGDAMGSILAMVPAGKGLSNDINLGAPVIRFGNEAEYLVYSSIGPETEAARHERADDKADPGASESEGVRLVAKASYRGRGGISASVKTVYEFLPDGRCDIVSTITNTGTGFFEGLSYSLFFNANYSYSFSPYDKSAHPGLNFRVYPKRSLSTAWVNHNEPLPDGADGPQMLDPRQSYEVRYSLLVGLTSGDVLERVYDLLETDAVTATAYFKGFPGRLMEVVVQDAMAGGVFYRMFMGNVPACEIVLPEGLYTVRANFFPAVVEKLLLVRAGEEANTVTLEDKPKGEVKVRIQDKAGRWVPGKVSFIGLDPTRSPYLEPDNPLVTGRGWETTKNSCKPGPEGMTVVLPAGTYLAVASRGPEFGTDEKTVEVFKDSRADLVFKVDRAVEPGSFVSLDPHLHTRFSDGTVGVPDRLKSIAAEGLGLAVSADHNTIVDYAKDLDGLGLTPYLTVVPGEEVTPGDSYVHFCAFPTPPKPGEPGNGAFLAPLVTGPVGPMLAAVREKFPNALLQLNHPRSGRLGLFNNAALDPGSAAEALETISFSFDLLEVMNGPSFYEGNEQAVADWLHLLNKGYRLPISASSDSHGADGQEPGYARVYVSCPPSPEGRGDWALAAAALKAGRSFVTTGPLVELSVNRSHAPGDLFTERSGQLDVAIKVRAAPWVDVSEIRLIVNGERKLVFPVKNGAASEVRLAEEVAFHVSTDSYLAVEVLGQRSLYPVVQRPSRTGSFREGALPYALTNPVFVDVDGNGRFDPPDPVKVRLLSLAAAAEALIKGGE
jgi:hypothetical protein